MKKPILVLIGTLAAFLGTTLSAQEVRYTLDAKCEEGSLVVTIEGSSTTVTRTIISYTNTIYRQVTTSNWVDLVVTQSRVITVEEFEEKPMGPWKGAAAVILLPIRSLLFPVLGECSECWPWTSKNVSKIRYVEVPEIVLTNVMEFSEMTVTVSQPVVKTNVQRAVTTFAPEKGVVRFTCLPDVLSVSSANVKDGKAVVAFDSRKIKNEKPRLQMVMIDVSYENVSTNLTLDVAELETIEERLDQVSKPGQE